MERATARRFIIVFFAFAFAGGYSSAHAASLRFSPSAGSYAVGDTVRVTVYVESPDQPVNAVSGDIAVPGDTLRYVSFSKSGSIINLWAEEPSFSSPRNTFHFEGVIMNPGYQGSRGDILTLAFKAIAPGGAPLSFPAGSALANDGKGTAILDTLGRASFTVGTAGEKPVVPAAASDAPAIASPTHPDPSAWYRNPDPRFVWELPKDVTAVRLLYDHLPSSSPVVLYPKPIAEKTLAGIEDGIWYFHAQFRNAKGWGSVSHFRFQIDTSPPEAFRITFPHGSTSTDPRPIALFNTNDALSGVSHYEVKIGEGSFYAVDPQTITSNPYALPVQAPGKRTIVVQAVDAAGNTVSAAQEFAIAPIDPPRILQYPDHSKEGDTIVISGQSYPDAVVSVFMKGSNGSIAREETRTTGLGDFTVVWPHHPRAGAYELWAVATDVRGAISDPSARALLQVDSSPLFRVGSFAAQYPAVTVALWAIFLLLLSAAARALAKAMRRRRKIHKSVVSAERVMHKVFDGVRESVRAQIKLLEHAKTKRELTREEERILKELTRELYRAEEIIEKEIEEIARK